MKHSIIIAGFIVSPILLFIGCKKTSSPTLPVELTPTVIVTPVDTPTITETPTITPTQVTHGGTGYDKGHSIDSTSDGAYIVGGTSTSYSAGWDVLLLKIDASGNELWHQVYDASSSLDNGLSVQETSDTGFIAAGLMITGGNLIEDIYLVKTDSGGNLSWEQTYGGPNEEEGEMVRQTSDGGYIIVGYTYSYGAGDRDVFLVKADSSGNTTWARTFGGTAPDHGYAVRQTSDDGYIVAGSYGAPSGRTQLYLVKTDSSGNQTWAQTYGGTWYDVAYDVQQTPDGGYVACGWRDSQAYLMKTDSSGSIVDEYYGPTGSRAYCVQQPAAGGYAMAGTIWGTPGNDNNAYLARLDSSCGLMWQGVYGDYFQNYCYSFVETAGGGFLLCGTTDQSGLETQVYLLKVDSSGIQEW